MKIVASALITAKVPILPLKYWFRYGHKHIAYIGSNHGILDETERKEGYLEALEAHNFPIVEQAIVHNSPDFEGGEKAMIDLLSYNSNFNRSGGL